MANFDLVTAQKLDLHLVSNVFEAGYAGLVEGVELSLDRGPDPLRPRDPSLQVGHGFIARDRTVDKEKGPLGCIYHSQGALSAMVYRAVVHTVMPEGRKSFQVLRTPTAEKPATSLVKISTRLPKGIKVRAVIGRDGQDHPLRVWSGVRTTGTVVLAYDGETLVELEIGEQLTIFFEDGFARQYEQDQDGIVEIELTPADMAKLRIDDAKARLASVTPEQWPDPGRRERQLHFILAGMVDLFHLAAKDEAVHKDLVQFFFSLRPAELQLVHRKLVAVLHQRNPLLAHAFTAPTSATVVPMKPRVPNPDAAATRAQIEARRQTLRDERNKLTQGMKGSSGGGKQPKQGGKKKGK